MNQDNSIENDLKTVNKGRGKKIAYLVLAVAGVAILIGVLIGKMRGTDVEESSAAMVEAIPQGNPEATLPDAAPQPSL